MTGRSARTARTNFCASQLVMRKHPWDSVLLMSSGEGVPWMP